MVESILLVGSRCFACIIFVLLLCSGFKLQPIAPSAPLSSTTTTTTTKEEMQMRGRTKREKKKTEADRKTCILNERLSLSRQ